MTLTDPRSPFGAPDTPRNRHYGLFYGFDDVPDDGRPVLVVHGNCQAESLRVLIECHFGDRLHAVRLVPAHELVADDVPHLHRWLARANYVVTQPIVDGYRGLPVGSRELLATAPQARGAIVPVLRWAGLHPTQVIVRSPAGDPPVVPYHDLRTVIAAATGDARVDPSPGAVEQLRELSLSELTRRIEAHSAVDVREALCRPGRRSVHVINHPTNPVLSEVATAVADALGLVNPRAADPGRILLGSIVAPMNLDAAASAGLEPTPDDEARLWRVGETPVADDEIAAAHLDWYARHPEALNAALTRHAVALQVLSGDSR